MNAPIDELDSDSLRGELYGLLRYINRVREEIASISRPADDEHEFSTMSDQLDAVIKATDEASNTIMACAESNEDALQELRGMVKDPPTRDQSGAFSHLRRRPRQCAHRTLGSRGNRKGRTQSH